MGFVDCPFCSQSHAPLLMCPPARRLLDALIEAGQRYGVPDVGEMTEVVGGERVAVAQLVVNPGAIEAAGTFVPVLVLTGLDVDRCPLPEWVFAADAPDMRKMTRLIRETGDTAIRQAREQNQARGRT